MHASHAGKQFQDAHIMQKLYLKMMCYTGKNHLVDLINLYLMIQIFSYSNFEFRSLGTSKYINIKVHLVGSAITTHVI